MNKNRIKKRSGFTLIEVIVVLVILAILAAIAVPALTGYIDEANDRKYISEYKSHQTAMQTLVASEWARGWRPGDSVDDSDYFDGPYASITPPVLDIRLHDNGQGEDSPGPKAYKKLTGDNKVLFLGGTISIMNSLIDEKGQIVGGVYFHLDGSDKADAIITSNTNFDLEYLPNTGFVTYKYGDNDEVDQALDLLNA